MQSGKLFLITVAGLVSAAFAYLGTGLHPVWWPLWLAPIPVLAIAPRLRGGAAFFLGAIVWSIGEMPRLYLASFEKCHRARSILPACIRAAGN
jgi:hypothetical protein